MVQSEDSVTLLATGSKHVENPLRENNNPDNICDSYYIRIEK
jgi:hypothetical protein